MMMTLKRIGICVSLILLVIAVPVNCPVRAGGLRVVVAVISIAWCVLRKTLRIGICVSLILLVIAVPVRGRADDLSAEDVAEDCASLDETTPSPTEEELLDLLTSINLQTLATPFWMHTAEEDVPAPKDKERRFALLLLLGLFSDVLTDERGGGLNLFVGPTQPGPGFPPPGGGTPGGGTNSPNFNLSNPFPPPNPPNTTLNNPFSFPEPTPSILIGVGLCAIAGYRLMRRKRSGASRR